ncbi:porin family protein, partial [Bifidobacterium longum]|uniref:porin family protein n=1 Tax=Bifidobacterium longum TaxID=216816 RepID=UPI0013F1725B
MDLRRTFLIASASALLLPAAVHAQQAGDWSGFYLGGNLGGSEPDSRGASRLEFDTGLDGRYGDRLLYTSDA